MGRCSGPAGGVKRKRWFSVGLSDDDDDEEEEESRESLGRWVGLGRGPRITDKELGDGSRGSRGSSPSRRPPQS